MTSFFRAYDLRGTFPDEIGEAEATRVGRAFGTYTDASRILVGRDGRIHAPEVASAFVAGVTDTGTDVITVGCVPTPLVRFAARTQDVGPTVMVTASHNPPEYIGFKFTTTDGAAMSRDAGMAEIQRLYESREFDNGDAEVIERDMLPTYRSYLGDRLGNVEDLTVAVNFANGAAGTVARDILERMGCTVIGINEEIDGRFPAHLPVPDDPAAISLVTDHLGEADIGIIFDGDADRVGLVLPEQGAIEADKLMAIFARECLQRREGAVVFSLDTSQLVPQIAREHGGSVHELRVGFTFISEFIHERSDVVFAGEPSGHYAFPAFDVAWDDGIFGAGLLCQLAGNTDLGGDIDAFPDYPVSPQHRLDCPERCKETVVAAIADEFESYDQSTVDGVKIFFEDGWALVRPSNTEPKLSVRCEADTEAALAAIEENMLEAVERLIEDCATS